MENLTVDQKKKLERLSTLFYHSENQDAIDILEKIFKLEDSLQAINTDIAKNLSELTQELNVAIETAKSVKGQKGDDGKTPSTQDLVSLIQPLIPNVKDGETPSKEQLVKLIKPLIPKVKDGITPSKKELLTLIRPLIPEVKNGKDAILPDLKELALNTIKTVEALEGDARLDFNALKNTPDYGKDIDTLAERTQLLVQIASQRSYTKAEVDALIGTSSGGGGNVETPSGTIDGANTVFTVSNAPIYINIDGVNKYETLHYTYSAGTITITDGSPPVLFIKSHY